MCPELAVGDLVHTQISNEWITGRVAETLPGGKFEVCLYGRDGITTEMISWKLLVKLPAKISPRKGITIKPSPDSVVKDADLYKYNGGDGMHLVEALCGFETPGTSPSCLITHPVSHLMFSLTPHVWLQA